MLYAWEAEEVRTGFRWEDQRERDRLEYLGTDGRMILKWIFKMWNEGAGRMQWIGLAQDRNRWQALLNKQNTQPDATISRKIYLVA
jgi:hypothetical protein